MTELSPTLFRRWLHVPEEDDPDVRVYRPAEYPLPPARGRGGIEFHADGTYADVRPGPVDAPVLSEPRPWTTERSGRLVLHDDAGRATTAFEIMDLGDDVLRLRPLAP